MTTTPEPVSPDDRDPFEVAYDDDRDLTGPERAALDDALTPPVSPAPDTEALRNQLARAISEQWLDDESLRGRTDYYSLTDAVLPIIAEREAGLRADLDRARRDVDRLTAAAHTHRENWMRVGRERDVLWDRATTAERQLERLRAESAGARLIPDDAVERIHAVVEELCTGQDDANGCTVYFLDHHEGPQELAREVLKALGATPTTGPAPAAADVQWGVQRADGVLDQMDDEADAREHLHWFDAGSAQVVSRNVVYGPWTPAPAAPQAPAEPTKKLATAKHPRNHSLDNHALHDCGGDPRCCGDPDDEAAREDTAPPARHETSIREDTKSVRGPGWYIAECDTCDWTSSGSEPVVEVAAAEHEDEADARRADTLRPSGPLTPIQPEEA